MLKFRTTMLAMAAVSAAALGAAAPAAATEGYAAIGFGARYKALAGAGVADSRDATAASLNPAGLVHVGDEIAVSFSAFSPIRNFSTNQPGLLIDQVDIDSDKNLFFIPNLAWSTRAFKNALFDVMAFSMVGNGGMNTSYPTFNQNSPFCGGAVQGTFCFGKSGVNLLQMVMSVAMAKQIAPGISIGVAPMFTIQSFEATGLNLFNGFSNDPGHVDAGRNDWTYGFGVRGGIEIAPMKNVRIGIAGTSPMYMDPFGQYSGLFAERGDFDIPASLHVGLAVDVRPDLTFMLDWRHIWYGSVDSIANPSANVLGCLAGGGPANPLCLGGSNGPGFGWKDLDAIKFGVEWRANDKMTLRGGYAYNTQPVRKQDVTFNILAPAVTQHHITGGLAYDIGGGYTLELAGMFAPQTSVTGPEIFDNNFGFGGQNVTLEMWQMEATVGIKYKFGADAEPLK